jgi:hypothetical protein
LREHTQLDCLTNTPLQALVHVFLPISGSEVGLGFGEAEWIDAAIEMRIARPAFIASDHDNGADRAILRENPGG